MRSCAGALSLLLQLMVAACASAPIASVYVLGSPVDANEERIARTAARIQVSSIAIPDYLNSTDILIRHGPHELTPSSTGRWGERLAEGMKDALASDLSARLPQNVITTDHDKDPLARQLLLSVSAFDVWANGRCVLTASWTIFEKGRGPSLIAAQETIVIPPTITGDTGDSLTVAAMAAAVAMLSDRVATSVAAIEQLPSASHSAPR